MQPHAGIFVAGHSGLAGSAIMRELRAAGYSNLVTRTHAELDLGNPDLVRRFFEIARPEYVFLAAGRVGGILANSTYPAEFIRENLAIQNNVIHEAWRVGVKRLLFLGSSCIYPRECPQPMREEYLLTGPLEPTNRPYAIAKIAGIEMCWAYNRQYRTRFLAAMPTNLYGPGDHYDLANSHVLPALIRKMHEAKTAAQPEVVIWGSGTPRREFLYSDDMAQACVFLMQLPNAQFDSLLNAEGRPPTVNIGAGDDLSIRELAQAAAQAVGCRSRLVFDTSKPDGPPRKLLDSSLLRSFGWRPRIGLAEGLPLAYRSFLDES